MFEDCSVLNQSFYNWDLSLSEIDDEILTKHDRMFKGCLRLEYYYADGHVTNSTIKNAYALFKTNQVEYNLKHRPFAGLNLLGVSILDDLFKNESTFNGNITNWNVSNVISLKSLFEGAASFNQDLNDWNVSNVEDVTGMFMNATSFHNPIWKWKLTKCRYFTNMFNGATSITISDLVGTNTFEQNNNLYFRLLI